MILCQELGEGKVGREVAKETQRWGCGVACVCVGGGVDGAEGDAEGWEVIRGPGLPTGDLPQAFKKIPRWGTSSSLEIKLTIYVITVA